MPSSQEDLVGPGAPPRGKYVKPQFERETVFETMALSRGKTSHHEECNRSGNHGGDGGGGKD
ncbi:MAG: hypothetical protein ACYC6M_10015 [Terriglobales bacterium]